MRWTIVHPGIVYVFSVRVPLSAPCGVLVRHPLMFSGTQTAPSRVQCVFVVWRACTASYRVQWYIEAALSRAQCVFFLSPAGRVHEARVNEKKKNAA